MANIRTFFFLVLASMAAYSANAYSANTPAEQTDTKLLNQQHVETFRFSSPENQRLALKLAKELRCPQCQNQNLIESNSPVAQDLLLKVYEQVETGASEKQVVEYMTYRFGNMVHYQPPFNSHTALLWLAPLMIVAGFALFIFKKVKR